MTQYTGNSVLSTQSAGNSVLEAQYICIGLYWQNCVTLLVTQFTSDMQEHSLTKCTDTVYWQMCMQSITVYWRHCEKACRVRQCIGNTMRRRSECDSVLVTM